MRKWKVMTYCCWIKLKVNRSGAQLSKLSVGLWKVKRCYLFIFHVYIQSFFTRFVFVISVTVVQSRRLKNKTHSLGFDKWLHYSHFCGIALICSFPTARVSYSLISSLFQYFSTCHTLHCWHAARRTSWTQKCFFFKTNIGEWFRVSTDCLCSRE